ncbi:hypothetical protein AB205_0091120 [Aquarana catesbeiana]|uniref:Ig-like domain-containing protein n=1 Tax=Aquarana catesbeiana TaxID=8400 RepID=A0A2G9RI90_AQUCT|nr:hypothetical protein AB205_0091120 [Aquarana catesbeiana]
MSLATTKTKSSSQQIITEKDNSASRQGSEYFTNSQDKHSTQPSVQSTRIPYYPERKDGFEGKNVFSIDSSTKSSTKVFLSETDIGPIYIHSTQKIISPSLSAGSTIISHQQIQIVKDVTTLVPTLRRYGRRRIPGRRRIVRPGRYPNFKIHQFGKFGKSILRELSTATTPHTTVSDTSEQNQLLYSPESSSTNIYTPTEQSTIRSLETMHGEETTTQANAGLKYSDPSISIEITPSQPVTYRNPKDVTLGMLIPGSTNRAITQTQAVTTDIPTRLSSTESAVLLKPTSYHVTTRHGVTSKVIRRKIPWHRLFGNSQINQREILKKIRKNSNAISVNNIHTPTSGIPPPKMSTAIESTQSTVSSSNISPITSLTTTESKTALYPKTVKATHFLINPDHDPDLVTPSTVHSTSVNEATSVINLVVSRTTPTSVFSTRSQNTAVSEPTDTTPATPFYHSSPGSQLAIVHSSATKAAATAASRTKPGGAKITIPTTNSSDAWSKTYPTTSFLDTTFKHVSFTSQKEDLSSTITPVTSAFVESTTRLRYLRRKRPRKKHPYSSFAKHNHWKSTTNSNKPTTPQEETTKSYKITPPSDSLPNTVTIAHKTAMATVKNDIPMTPVKIFFLTSTSKAPRLFLQPSPVLNGTDTLPTQHLEPSDNNFVVTSDQALNSKNNFKNTIVTTAKPKATSSNHKDNSASTVYPQSVTAKIISSLTDPSPILSPSITQPPFISGKKVATSNVEVRPDTKTSDRKVHIIAHIPGVLKKTVPFNPSFTTAQETDKKATFNKLEVGPSNNDRSKARIKGGKAASFTVLANSDAFIPCEATGTPTPTILWTKVSSELIKCKRDRSGQQCPLCSTPQKNKGKSLNELTSQDLSCAKPVIENIYKLKNVTTPEEGSFMVISAKDFVAPMGSLVLNMTDQNGNEANLACNVQRPTKMSQITLDRKDEYTIMRTTFSSFLVCSIDYDHIQKLWGILAMYSDSPMKLKRDLLLTKSPFISYKYKQVESGDDVFTDIEADFRAEPTWLMQDLVTLQLDRSATTLNMLHIKYLTDVYITIPNSVHNPAKNSWVMIKKSNQTRTEHAAIIGGTVEINCQVDGDPAPNIEWVLPDGSKIRAPYLSEEGRITITRDGKFTLKAADSFDTGVYHCIATNYVEADVLSFRVTVVSADVEEEAVNGGELSVTNGDMLYLPCGSNGVPDASVNWILPDHSVLQETSRNKLIFPNGTLKIQDTTQRERGHFICIAANQYGLDILTHRVFVKERKLEFTNKKTQLDRTENETNEGSGTEEVKENNYLATGKVVTHRRFPTRRINTKLDSQGNVNTEVHRRNRINQRLRGYRRQFTKNTRRIDPQRWTEILEKTKKGSVNSQTPIQKEENITEIVSGEPDEASGEEFLPVAEKFLIVTEKHSTQYGTTTTSTNTQSYAPSLATSKNANIHQDNIHKTAVNREITATTGDSIISEYSYKSTKSPQYIDTFTHNTVSYNNEQLTTISILNTTSVAAVPAPEATTGTFVSKTRRGNRMEVFPNGTLFISNVGIQDRGQYLCVATNQYGSDRLLVTLSVITYPPRILQGKSREITVHSGSSINLKCQAEARPFPTITWILSNETIASEKSAHNHKVFVQTDGTLIIKEVSIYDRGIYKCLATNIAGSDTFTVRIQVIAAPPVILEDKRQTVLALSGENVKLHCSAKGNPQPSVHWVAFDGTKVKPLQYVNAKLFLFSNGTLYIRNAEPRDNGNYECIATSSTGSERRVVSLHVEQIETIPRIVHASPKYTEMNYGDKLVLNCTATGEPKPRIIWRLPSKAVVDQWHR